MDSKYKSKNIKVKDVVKEQSSLWENNIENNNQKEKFVKLIFGDVRKALDILPDNFIDCIITSPPYWKQRDYKHKKQIGQESSYYDYINNLIEVFNKLKRILKPTGTFFLNIGYKWQEKELLLIPDLLAIEMQKNGWALINKIIWSKPNAMPSSFEKRFSNVYEPVYLFVKKESKYNYYLSLDTLRIPLRDDTIKRRPEDIIGYEVRSSLTKKESKKGFISKIFKDGKNNLWAEIIWDDKNISINLIQDFSQESQLEVILLCEKCFKKIENEADVLNHYYCDGFPKPILPEKNNLDNLEEISLPFLFSIEKASKGNNYSGKFLKNPENRGASPGARKSLFGEYFVVQRRFKIFQPIIANYLRHWKKKTNVSTKRIDEILGYKDTASHWFRRDTGSWGKGGSIPLPEDWLKLKEILGFDDIYDRWITETHLVLQTVKPHPKGKNPGDVWNIKTKPFTDAHFAVFPEELVRKCMEAGCPKNGTVLDPFAGSGTVGKVAEELNRNAILIELITEYLEIIKKRVLNIKEVIYVK